MTSVNVCQVMAFSLLTLFFVIAYFFLIWPWNKSDTLAAIIHPPQIITTDQNNSVQFDNGSDLSMLHFFSSYHVKGYLRLPHSNIIEPIEVWFNKKKKKSRIDYYDSEVKTFQDGNIGLQVKVTPRYDSITKKYSTGCWKKLKPKELKNAQSIIPRDWSWPFHATLKSFKYIGDDYVKGRLCTVWKFTHKVYEKNNVYTFWVEKRDPPVPVCYEMNGYDTLMTSYYDKYVIEYTVYEKWDYDENIMEIPQVSGSFGEKCQDLKDILHQGDGGEFEVNPIAEFVSSNEQDDHTESEFHRYKKKHGKEYDKHEHHKRKDVFTHNKRFIHSVNRQHRQFKLKLNSFADMTDDEYNLHKGALPDNDDKEREIKRERRSHFKFMIDEHYTPRRRSAKIPDRLDWRKYGAVNRPRGQGTCGSCWAFAAVGAMEGANFLKTGKLVELSEQQLMDCTWNVKGLYKNKGNNGCHGGFSWKGLFWARSNKLATRESYGPYRGQEGYCKTDHYKVGATIYGFRRVKRWNPTALRKAVAYHGPAAVSVNSHPLTLKFYSSGILDDKKCRAVTPVSSQGLCGSCWAFAIAGPIEAHHFFQTGRLEEVSKQQILDCTWGVGNNGCRGGFPVKVFDWITKNGIATKKSYGPYLGQEAYCHCGKEDNCTIIHDTKDFYRVKPLTTKSLKVALSKYGPVSCSINADAKTLRFYSSGIYSDPQFSRAVTPVSSQGLCGSCWAFAIAGPIEAHHFFQTGRLEEVSKQQILDCTWGVGNNGCRGGFPVKVFDWITKNGIATKKSYGPYLGQEAYCHCGKEDNCTIIHDTKDFYRVKPLTTKSLKVALSKYGPVSCSINADAKTLRFYSSGIYSDPQFSREPANHAATCVGYGEGNNGEPYWVIKNTWGRLWGERGYLRIAKRGNIANIHGGTSLAIKKHANLPEFPYQALKKVKRNDVAYERLPITSF